MKTIYTLLICFVVNIPAFAQSTIQTAMHFTFSNYINYFPPLGTVPPVGPDYGCITSHLGRPSWFYFNVCGADSGAVVPRLAISGTWNNYDGLIIWGPFDDTTNLISKLTAANIDTCAWIGGGSLFFQLPTLEYPKFYIGMVSVLDSSGAPSINALWTGGNWVDLRCGISNSRIANYKQDICMVTLDSTTQKNMIIWEKKDNYQIASVNIYREGFNAGQYDSIGNVPITADGYFIDQAVNPNQKSYKYRTSGLDSSGQTFYGNYSNQGYHDSSIVHETIHLLGSLGLNNEVNLSWNAYKGFAYSTFYIYRGTSSANAQLIDSVSATTYSYSDYNAQPGLNYYRVVVNKSSGCSPDGIIVYSQVHSNNPVATITGLENIYYSNDFNIYPNPAINTFTISFTKDINDGVINIYNLIGEKLYSRNFTGKELIIENKLERGVYSLQFTSGNKTVNKQLIIK
jgi:hypothetical protein